MEGSSQDQERIGQNLEKASQNQDGTRQPYSHQETDNRAFPATKEDWPGNSENISDSPQRVYAKAQRRRETLGTDGYSSDEDEVQRLTMLPQGPSVVSEEELTQLALIKPSRSKCGLRHNARQLIQKIQRQMEEQEILKEFLSLEHLKPLDDCQVAKTPENREKNRYRDILPYDATRVPIGEAKGYINASYIHVPVGTEELWYISTQGPLLSTTHDFWQMVWENNSNVIAMITREQEHGVSKCHRYWPEPPHNSLDLLRFRLQLLNYQILDYFVIRIIEMINKLTQERRVVQHLQFTNWPDHGTPKSLQHLVKFVRYMRKTHQSGPVIAHCSAGIGRSGVLLCVDIVLIYIEKDLCFDIKQIVTHMRNQRFGMIQTKEQYVFCYEIALEALKNIQSRDSQ
ncbi:tyrosine-protein phosphatase non-receptor type 20-like [Pantherophis guttatus]|uniref:Tyrosine-protein phosphatase non-receptor type 20 n=1 Tax=Pantherophis guttatus TaxID=94885 RepID=A0A6P9BWE6_PANGU|nr:tyrosine-protein phosphatase non-receptor type 20 [Pantherophis guttatus]XP_034275993.1 tyrosine-protein phosphatase non-receptor type 20 [Pantherophis guttatus]XP_060542414.1 tyrosine-protein phosphatase non-receptor type 20-like [Pantherophis guttatus]XP_060542416.1 tyrosine-protein phosphatase non-receptor type 20-like [Pantherophis guttatus]